MKGTVFPLKERLRNCRPAIVGLTGVGALCFGLILPGCATPPGGVEAVGSITEGNAVGLADQYGVQIEGLRRTAAGSMLDMRYRVLDAQKAAPFLNGKIQPYIVDEVRSARLGVPDTPTLGRIRQTARNGVIHTDRSYFVMFGNPGKAIQSGDKVALYLGQVKITDLTVQ